MACRCILNSAYGVQQHTVLRMHTGCIPVQRQPAYVICPSTEDILHIREHVFANLTGMLCCGSMEVVCKATNRRRNAWNLTGQQPLRGQNGLPSTEAARRGGGTSAPLPTKKQAVGESPTRITCGITPVDTARAMTGGGLSGNGQSWALRNNCICLQE